MVPRWQWCENTVTSEVCTHDRIATSLLPLYHMGKALHDMMCVCVNCTIVSCMHAPFEYKPPTLPTFSAEVLAQIFLLSPTMYGHAMNSAMWSLGNSSSGLRLLHCRVQGLNGGVATQRVKPASTEQLRNLPLITSVFVSGINATTHWKDKPMECLENAIVYAVANLCQSIFTIKFLEDERNEGRLVSNQLLSVCNNPMSASMCGTGRGGMFAR